MKSVATDKLTTANLHKCVNQDKMIKTEHTLVLKMLKYSWKRSLMVQDQVVGSRMYEASSQCKYLKFDVPTKFWCICHLKYWCLIKLRWYTTQGRTLLYFMIVSKYFPRKVRLNNDWVSENQWLSQWQCSVSSLTQAYWRVVRGCVIIPTLRQLNNAVQRWNGRCCFLRSSLGRYCFLRSSLVGVAFLGVH